jgi:hypothetical protein
VPPHKVEVIDPPKEKKSNENIKEKPLKVIIRHDDSKNTSGDKDRTFRATHGNPKIIASIKQFGALRVKKKTEFIL